MSIKSCLYTLLLLHTLTNTNLCSDNIPNQAQAVSLSTKVQELTNDITSFTQEVTQSCFTYNQCIANTGLPQTVIEALKKDQSEKQKEWKKRYETLTTTFHTLEKTYNYKKMHSLEIQKLNTSRDIPECNVSEIYAQFQKTLKLNEELKNLLDQLV